MNNELKAADAVLPDQKPFPFTRPIRPWGESEEDHIKNNPDPNTLLAKPDNEMSAEELRLKWREGIPPHPYDKEWFIAMTTYGDRVVLTALPKEYSYDFKTADETYIKKDKIKKWMQFPDSDFIEPKIVKEFCTAEELAKKLQDYCADQVWHNPQYVLQLIKQRDAALLASRVGDVDLEKLKDAVHCFSSFDIPNNLRIDDGRFFHNLSGNYLKILIEASKSYLNQAKDSQ